MADDARWFAGIDWPSQTHRVCLIDADGKMIGERAFAHGGAGLADLCAWLLSMTGAESATSAVADLRRGLLDRHADQLCRLQLLRQDSPHQPVRPG